MVVLAVIGAAALAVAPANGCTASRTDEPAIAVKRRLIEDEDLLGLHDIGESYETVSGPSPLALSPDGAHVAVQVRTADAAVNRYCVRLLLIPLDGSGRARILDARDGAIRAANRIRGLDLGMSGIAKVIVPRWSPDGRRIAYLANDGADAAIRVVRLDGEGGTTLNLGPGRFEDVEWAADGTTLLASGPATREQEIAQIVGEGRHGYLYDHRFWPLSEHRPALPADAPARRVAIDATTGRITSQSQGKPAELNPVTDAASNAELVASSADGRAIASIEPLDTGFLAPTRLRVRSGSVEFACPAEACGDRATGIWWFGRELLILRRESNPVPGRMALYSWTPGVSAPRRLLRTEALVSGCVATPRKLLCLWESALRPRRIVAIEAQTGKISEIYDPNPIFRRLALGRSRRLTWTDRFGTRTFGNLVLPPTHRAGQTHPLIVVSYVSRGFLRGGTGDEYPIQLLARAGYAVLSWQENSRISGLLPARNFDEYQRRAVDDATLRKRLFAQLEAGLTAAVRTGAIDASKMGITGLSDGASTACFALINSRLFKAAALSSGCEDPEIFFGHVGPAFRDEMIRWGYPAPGDPKDDYWRYTSLARSAPRVTAPILINSSDGEYRGALNSIDALRRHHVPVEMYIFPDEGHIKWQPAHRAAIYRRNIDWFDFWLRGWERPDEADAGRYVRWRTMRAEWNKARNGDHVQDAAHVSTSSRASTRRRSAPSPSR